MAKIGLVTVLFNSNEVLEGFFKSLADQSFQDFHLYIVDNTPGQKTDELLDTLLAKYSILQVTHIKNETNVGVARGNNQGIELSFKANHLYTILLNNDIEFEQPHLLQEMVKQAETSSETMIIPKVYFWDSKKVWMAGGKLFRYSAKTIHIGEGKEDGKAYQANKHFSYAPTCFMLIKRQVFEQIGLMDERYFVYYDDTDFVYRAVQKGHQVFMMHMLHVYHKVSSSTGGGLSLFTIYYGNRNRIFFIRKNFKGFYYYLSMCTTLITRLFNHIRYTPDQRKKMWQGISEGFKM